MKINCHTIGIEKEVASGQLAAFLSKVFAARIVDDSDEDYLEHDGWYEYSLHTLGFATHINIELLTSPHDLSHEELAPLIAREFQTRVIVDLANDHPLVLHPYYWQLFDADGLRYLISDREPDDDECDDEDFEHGFLINRIAPWPGESIYPGCDDDD